MYVLLGLRCHDMCRWDCSVWIAPRGMQGFLFGLLRISLHDGPGRPMCWNEASNRLMRLVSAWRGLRACARNVYSDNKLGAKGVMELAAALRGLEHLHTLVLRCSCCRRQCRHRRAGTASGRSDRRTLFQLSCSSHLCDPEVLGLKSLPPGLR